MAKISIIIPVYNEKKYILNILQKVKDSSYLNFEKEIVVVDDGSSDGTTELLKNLSNYSQGDYKVVFHKKNLGKGAALKTGFKNSSGDIIAIQDADLEYNPEDIAQLLLPIANGSVLVVYGSRMTGNNPIGHYSYYFGNILISKITNLLYRSKLTDVETCYKVFNRQVLSDINLIQNDFAFEVEFTAKLLKNKVKIIEVPISYSPRKFNEGKKINWTDGVKAIWFLIKYRFKNT